MTSETWTGITVSGDSVIVVGFSIPIKDGGLNTFRLEEDITWRLQKGDKACAYRVMYERVINHIRESNTVYVVIKGSATSSNTTVKHLYSAELRGVIIAAASSVTKHVMIIPKSTTSRKFGTRKADEYIHDDTFWHSCGLDSSLRKGSREIALIVMDAKKNNS